MSLVIHRRRLLAAAASAALAMPHVARAAPRVIKLGHNSTPTSQYGAGCLAMAEAAARHPNLAGVTIEVHGNAEFGDEGPMLNDVRAGILDMMAGVTSSATTICPEIGMLDVPFVFKDVARGRAAFDGKLGEEYAELLKAKGVFVVGWLENGLRHVTSNRAVRQPEDLVGLKLRTPPSQVAVDSFRSLGADAKPLAFNLVYEALRTGQFDAQENPIASAETIKLFQVQKFLCLTGHTYSAGLIAMSPDLVEDLTPTQLAALKTCAVAGKQRSREIAEAADRDGVGRLRKAGMTIVDDVNKEAFVAAARPNLVRLGGQFGAERVERLMQAGA
jgi:tripartite ATP-independent transporter DctP family solute receptor